MIRIACTNCKTILSIDDAFAGGVCRCQHCGTIQTVPAHAKDRATAGASAPVSGSKAIYHRGGKADSSADSLDELTAAVASSGLSGSGLTSNRLSRSPSSSAGGGKNMTMIFAAVGGVIVVLLIVIIWLMTRGGSSNTAASNGGTDQPSGPSNFNNTVAATGPNFCGKVKLDAPSVIYVLDRGSGTKEVFGGLKDATLKSAASLGSERKFEIVFWNNGSDAAYPEGSTTYATKENLAAAARAIDDVFAFGASDAKSALQKAISHDPGVIVLATAKGYDLDDAWVHDMLDARGSSSVKIHAIDLGTGGASQALKTLAAKTGGEYHQVSSADLSTSAGH